MSVTARGYLVAFGIIVVGAGIFAGVWLYGEYERAYTVQVNRIAQLERSYFAVSAKLDTVEREAAANRSAIERAAEHRMQLEDVSRLTVDAQGRIVDRIESLAEEDRELLELAAETVQALTSLQVRVHDNHDAMLGAHGVQGARLDHAEGQIKELYDWAGGVAEALNRR